MHGREIMMRIIIAWFALGLFWAVICIRNQAKDNGKITVGDIGSATFFTMLGPITYIALAGALIVAGMGDLNNRIRRYNPIDKVVWQKKTKT